MNKILSSILPVLLTASFILPKNASLEEKIKKGYSNIKIEYFDFHNINSLDIPIYQLRMDPQLSNMINKNKAVKILNPLLFQREVLGVAETIGYNKEKISKLDPLKLIKLSSKIVSKKMDIEDVDDKEFQKKFKSKFIDDYFYLKKGDCQRFADATIAVYDFLKEINSDLRTKNIYLTRQIGGNNQPHQWNSIIIPTLNKIYTSQIDVWDYEKGRGLEAGLYHISKKSFDYRFLREYGDYEKSNSIIDSLLYDEEDSEKRSQLFGERAWNNGRMKKYSEAYKDYIKAAYLTEDIEHGDWLRGMSKWFFKRFENADKIKIKK